MITRQKDQEKEKFTIEIGLTEFGRVITMEYYLLHPFCQVSFQNQISQVESYVTQIVCPKHLRGPKIEIRESAGKIVIGVDCCCSDFLKEVSKRLER